jgi:hypothetical protein
MDLYILDVDFEALGVIDDADSIIWTKRYFQAGEFEIYTMATAKVLELLKIGRYVTRKDDESVGIVESLNITSNEEEGEYITAAGRFSESILGRRIIWQQTRLYGGFEEEMYRLIRENAVAPSLADRKISIIALEEASSVDKRIECQMTGDNLLAAIEEKCTIEGIGFKMTLNNGKFHFGFYRGKDRSKGQMKNPHVIFSDEYDTLEESSYLVETKELANVALVAGEGEGLERRTTTIGEGSGLNRYEVFVDAKDVSSNKGEISDADYLAALKEKGAERLARITEVFDGAIISEGKYTYKIDYDLGDIVTVENSRWGISIDARIIEIIECEDETGHHVAPSFGR